MRHKKSWIGSLTPCSSEPSSPRHHVCKLCAMCASSKLCASESQKANKQRKLTFGPFFACEVLFFSKFVNSQIFDYHDLSNIQHLNRIHQLGYILASQPLKVSRKYTSFGVTVVINKSTKFTLLLLDVCIHLHI